MSEVKELRECPFCAQVWPELAVEVESQRDFRVVCSNGHKSAWMPTREEAVKNWNTRANPIPDTKEKMRMMLKLFYSQMFFNSNIDEAIDEFLKQEQK